MEFTLLELPAGVEPDRRRLAGFAIDAVRALGGGEFAAAAILAATLERLRQASRSADSAFRAALLVRDATLLLHWQEHEVPLGELPAVPSTAVLEQLAANLHRVSESSDPELLRRRNQQFEAELEQARERAAREMAELEADLERKRSELQSSIRKAETDALTGLFNRGAFDGRAHASLLHCARQGEPLCLLLLDLDFFKDINDTHGHQYGDEYLRQMANVMRASIREHVDQAFRIGGDEFAILVFADSATGKEVARRILLGMGHRVSIGIALLRPDDSVETLVARADEALYDVKRRGRGRITCSEDDALHPAEPPQDTAVAESTSRG